MPPGDISLHGFPSGHAVGLSELAAYSGHTVNVGVLCEGN